MQPLKRTSDINANSNVDYSFLFSKLDQLNEENSRYKRAITQIEEVADQISRGNLSARIAHSERLDKLSNVFSAVNRAYDFADNFIRETEVSQQIALKNQDNFRKKQLRELKDYFEKQIVHVLR